MIFVPAEFWKKEWRTEGTGKQRGREECAVFMVFSVYGRRFRSHHEHDIYINIYIYIPWFRGKEERVSPPTQAVHVTKRWVVPRGKRAYCFPLFLSCFLNAERNAEERAFARALLLRQWNEINSPRLLSFVSWSSIVGPRYTEIRKQERTPLRNRDYGVYEWVEKGGTCLRLILH